MHKDISFTHMIVRYDAVDTALAVTVAFATSIEEATMLLCCFIELASYFAPTAVYAIRDLSAVSLYQKVYSI